MESKLKFLKQLAHGLAVQFGSSCEVVIHDLRKKDLEHSIAYIENGHISDRRVGDGPSEIVLESLGCEAAEATDRLSYLTKTKDGRILKSSTLYIRDEDGSIEFIFSINYEITALLEAERELHELLHTEKPPSSCESEEPTKITQNVTELLDRLIEQAIARVGKPVELMNKDDKIEVVQYLKNAGAFLITKSGDKVSALLGISKYTLYSYMDKR